jgi:hypothetical protein
VRPLGNLALTVAGFACTLGLAKGLVTAAPSETERAYARAFASAARCTVLFVGPSYVDEQVLPDAFDDEAARIGLAARACKFGLSYPQGEALVRHLERLLAHPFPELELVVLDVTLGKEPWLEPRAERDTPLLERETAEHAASLLGAGSLARALSRGLFASRAPEAPRELHANESRSLTYAEKLEKLRRDKPEARLRPEDDAWFVELRDRVERTGRETYFLLAPVWFARSPPAVVQGDEDSLVLLDFNDPDAYPVLYDERSRGQSSRLSARGRQLYARHLAHAIAERRSRAP